jgi:hypothetical protein
MNQTGPWFQVPGSSKTHFYRISKLGGKEREDFVLDKG